MTIITGFYLTILKCDIILVDYVKLKFRDTCTHSIDSICNTRYVDPGRVCRSCNPRGLPLRLA